MRNVVTYLGPLLLTTALACGEDSGNDPGPTVPEGTGSQPTSTSPPASSPALPSSMPTPSATAPNPTATEPGGSGQMPTVEPTGPAGGQPGTSPSATSPMGGAGGNPNVSPSPTTPSGQGGDEGMGGMGGMPSAAGAGGEENAGPATAEELYIQHCSACHGADATGGDLGPNVRYVDSGLSHFLVREGRESMTYPAPMVPIPEESLSDEGVDLIVEYLWSFPKPTTGEELFQQICAKCHGADGAGGPTGRPVIGEAHAAEQIVRNGHNGAYDDRREFMPAYDQQQITDQELQLIIAYIETL